MESSSLWGGLLPLWIIGAPWVLAFIELSRTPKPRVRYDNTATSSSTSAPYVRPA